jgi:hypothetical protein
MQCLNSRPCLIPSLQGEETNTTYMPCDHWNWWSSHPRVLKVSPQYKSFLLFDMSLHMISFFKNRWHSCQYNLFTTGNFNSLFILPRISLIINCCSSYFKVASLHGLILNLLQRFYKIHHLIMVLGSHKWWMMWWWGSKCHREW